MDTTSTQNDGFAEAILASVRKTTPSASLGLPPREKLERLRQLHHLRDRQRIERMIEEDDRRFRRLKQAALANIGKDRP